jgi:hypothetical protein
MATFADWFLRPIETLEQEYGGQTPRDLYIDEDLNLSIPSVGPREIGIRITTDEPRYVVVEVPGTKVEVVIR